MNESPVTLYGDNGSECELYVEPLANGGVAFKSRQVGFFWEFFQDRFDHSTETREWSNCHVEGVLLNDRRLFLEIRDRFGTRHRSIEINSELLASRIASVV